MARQTVDSVHSIQQSIKLTTHTKQFMLYASDLCCILTDQPLRSFW